MTAVWPAKPGPSERMPPLIVIPNGATHDVLAWFVTYTRDYRPFTAFCRVVESSVAEQFVAGPSSPSLSGMGGICASLVLGEALAQSRGAAGVLDLPSTVYSATLSYAICRMFALTGGTMSLRGVTEAWLHTRSLTGQLDLTVPPDVIHWVCGIVMGFFGATLPDRLQSDACASAWSDIMRGGEISEPSWMRLVDGFPEIEPMRQLVKVPREQRLRGVEIGIHSLIQVRREGVDRRSFLAGYFASLLAPGSLEHADVLEPVVTMLPASLMWYCLFAAANNRGDFFPSGSIVARRIIRDLTLPDRIIDRPRCDIAMEELALPLATIHPVSVGTGKAGRLDVDLLPGVTTSVRWPSRQSADEAAVRRVRDAEVQQIAAEMHMLNDHQRMLGERLREALGMEGHSRPAVAPSPRKRKGGS